MSDQDMLTAYLTTSVNSNQVKQLSLKDEYLPCCVSENTDMGMKSLDISMA